MATNTWTEVMPKLLAQGLLVLRQNAIMPRLVNRKYERLAGEKGSQIDIPIFSAASATAVTPGPTPPASVGNTPTKVSITLDQWYESPFHMTDKEMMEVMDGVIPGQAASCVKALANNVDSAILACYKSIYGYAGTAGTTPFATDLSAYTNARTVLNKQLTPVTQNERFVVLDADAEGKAVGRPEFQSAAYSGSTQTIVEGTIGYRLGALWAMDQNVPTHTAGTITTGLIAKAATVVAAGLKTFLGTTAASTGACALVIGDIINIAGHTQTYVLTAAATQASAASDVTLAFEPGLQFALAGSEAITVKASHVVNLNAHRDCISFVNRPLVTDADNMANAMSMYDEVSGLTLRLEKTREHRQVKYAFDILYGVKCTRPEYGARIAG